MNGYVIFLSNGILKIFSNTLPDTVFEKRIAPEIANGSKIIDPKAFAEQIGQLIFDSYGSKAPKQGVHFLIDLPDFYPKFILSNKTDSASESQMLENEIAKKLEEEKLDPENVFVSTLKIAPFVYQFLAVEKPILESYIEVSNHLGLPLVSVVPWGMLLPSIMSKSGDPEIFIITNEDAVWLVLSELNGVYHVGSIKESKDIKGLSELVKKLSVYERANPIKKIYTMNMPGLSLGNGFEVTELSYTNPNIVYAEHVSKEVLEGQLNLLNMLPIPAKQAPSAMVYVGAVTAALLILGGIAFGPKYFKGDTTNLAANPAGESNVLSESKENTTQTTQENQKPAENPAKSPEDVTAKPELKRAYLKIRVENGTNIAGLAGKTRDYLTGLGYEVVAIGDSDESNRDAVLIRFKSANSIYKDLLVEDLNKKFTKVEVGKELDASLPYDTLIVAGNAQVK